jgi:hypothetical protein
MRITQLWGKIALSAAILMFACLFCERVEAENESLEEGIRLYEDLEYEPAQTMLETALAKEGSTKEELARAALYLGVVHVALGDAAAGETWFTVALAYDETLQVPGGTSPKIAEQFDALAAKLTFARPITAEAAEKPDLVTPATPAIDALVNAPEPAPEQSMMWTYVAGGATVAALGAAVTYALLARSTASDIESRPHERAELQDLQDQLDTQGAVANTFLAMTGALAATTAIVYWTQRPGKTTTRESPTISVTGSADGASVGALFSF